MKRRFNLTVVAAGALTLVLLAAAACVPVPPAVAPAAAPAAAPASASSNTITGIVWQWVSVTDQTTKQTTTVPNPASYTIIFNADGTTYGKADCNSFTGTWSQQNGFDIQVVPNVMAACGTLDSQYLDPAEPGGGRRPGWRRQPRAGNGRRGTAHAVQERRPRARGARSTAGIQ